MKNGGEGLPSIILDSQCLSVEMLINLDRRVYFNQILHTNTFLHYRDTGTQYMQNGDWALPRKVLHYCVCVMLKCIRTRFRTEPISEHLC